MTGAKNCALTSPSEHALIDGSYSPPQELLLSGLGSTSGVPHIAADLSRRASSAALVQNRTVVETLRARKLVERFSAWQSATYLREF
jgi:hypothetical protein